MPPIIIGDIGGERQTRAFLFAPEQLGAEERGHRLIHGAGRAPVPEGPQRPGCEGSGFWAFSEQCGCGGQKPVTKYVIT